MVSPLEASARRHALTATALAVTPYGFWVAVWFVHDERGVTAPWPIIAGLSLALPVIAVLVVPLGRVADLLQAGVRPSPPTVQFHNVVSEIAVALNEPVEHIVTHHSEIANVAMLPTSQGEVVMATSGALGGLGRYELQALVAAQFAGMRDRWCRLSTRAEILWWGLPFLGGVTPLAFVTGRWAVPVYTFCVVVITRFFPRWIEHARDLCADVAAVRTTFDPSSLAGAMRKIAEHSDRAHETDFGGWCTPISPFLVLPRRVESTTTVSSGDRVKRQWTSVDEVRLELLLRADRAEAMAAGVDPRKLTGREYRRRWRQLGH